MLQDDHNSNQHVSFIKLTALATIVRLELMFVASVLVANQLQYLWLLISKQDSSIRKFHY